jgi:hypothetical protein
MPSDWNEHARRVTRAFSDWLGVERDQRAFLTLGLRFARAAYDRAWQEASEEPGDPDGPDLPDAFHHKVEGFWPHDFEWMLNAAVLRDAVTGYEVYLEKAREEVLAHHGSGTGVPELSPPYWSVVVPFYLQLGINLDRSDVADVRGLRHFLVHRRGELRTEAERARFERDSDDLPSLAVELDDVQVFAAMDTLAAAVRQIDAVAYQHTWGGKRIEGLKP